jgi:hypothetical protein
MRVVPVCGQPAGEPTDASRPPGEWRLYYSGFIGCLAPPLEDVLVWREGWDAPMRRSKLHPSSNVVGLLWQPST